MSSPPSFKYTEPTRLLSSLSISDYLKHPVDRRPNVTEVRENDTIEHALKILSREGVLSVPVRASDSIDYIGFVDMLDILTFIMRMYTTGTNETPEEGWAPFLTDFETLEHRGVRFGIKPVSQVINESNNDPFLPVYGHGTLLQAADEVFSQGVHRAPVLDENNHMVNIISQSDIIKYLAEDISKLGPLQNMTVGELDLGSVPPATMSIRAQAIHGFYLMLFNKVSAIAITNDTGGEILGNLSISDLRSFKTEHFSRLLEPVSSFIMKRINLPPGGPRPSIEVRQHPITVSRRSTFGSVLLKCALYRLHRVWVVDESHRPTGVISLTDIIKTVCTYKNA
eukprot:Rmarinus@m.18864